ncbi:MAG: hypothetical protein M1820_008614 [Bogoriella megaspora]|nr:MAG: hypothetical protein M1820_008614 [Bogoriella megaspora]
MCRRHHHRRPLVVTAGVLAYQQYQKHQEQKQLREDNIKNTIALAAAANPSIPADAPPDYDTAVSSQFSTGDHTSFTDEKHPSVPEITDIRSMSSGSSSSSSYSTVLTPPSTASSASSSPAPIYQSISTQTQSFNTHTKVKNGTTKRITLTSSSSNSTVYKIRYNKSAADVLIQRKGSNSDTIGTANYSPDAASLSADVSLDTMTRTKLLPVQIAQGIGYEISLPRGDGGEERFRWVSGIGGEIGNGVWRLEDSVGAVWAVFVDAVGKGGEGRLEVLRGVEELKMVDAVVGSWGVAMGMVGR